MIDGNLLREAIEVWGEDAQIRMAIEECGELIVVVAQWQRGRRTKLDVAEEIADVIILSEQMRQMFGTEIVDEIIVRKMDRLEARLSKRDINGSVR